MRLDMPDDLCRSIVKGGFYKAWDDPQQNRPVSARAAEVVAAAPSPVPLAVMPAPPLLTLSPGSGFDPSDGGGPSTNPKYNPDIRPK